MTVEEELKKTYDGPIFEKGGYSYIPWNDTAGELNRVFGELGWDFTDVKITFYEGVGFSCVGTLRIHSVDSAAWETDKDGVGFGELIEKLGARGYDTAIKAAASDALSRAAKLLGSRFGLNLYDKEAPVEPAKKSYAAPKTTTTNYKTNKPTDKMIASLIYRGVPEAVAPHLTFDEASEIIKRSIGGEAVEDILSSFSV